VSRTRDQGTVLVAEGQHDTRLMMKLALEQLGYHVLLAGTESRLWSLPNASRTRCMRCPRPGADAPVRRNVSDVGY